MKNISNQKTKVVHSKSKNAWNVVSETLGAKYKVARVPYTIFNDEIIDTMNKAEALEYAKYISKCFNNYDKIMNFI